MLFTLEPLIKEHACCSAATSSTMLLQEAGWGGGGGGGGMPPYFLDKHRAENKDFRLIGYLCASRFPSMVMPGQITNLTCQKAILFGICLMAACYFQF